MGRGSSGSFLLWLLAACACGSGAPSAEGASSAGGEASAHEVDDGASASQTESASASEGTGEAESSHEESSESMPSADVTGETEGGGEAETGTQEGEVDGTSGDAGCVRNVVLMGYWPPTNEMLRQWSPNLEQNPNGWQGENWGGHGFDVYAFFPEFPPDGDPSNDAIGEPGAVGSPDSDLQVDYQDTSEDFWRIVDEYQPVLTITTSRGGEIGWELEAVEGGHGNMRGLANPALDWSSDGFGADLLPTEASIEARSWEGISTYRQGVTLASQLPMEAILSAATELSLVDVQIDQGTSGNFLSGFLGLHGLLYDELAPHSAAAGHIHVGFGVEVIDAEALMEASLEALFEAHPADSLDCSPVR